MQVNRLKVPPEHVLQSLLGDAETTQLYFEEENKVITSMHESI